MYTEQEQKEYMKVWFSLAEEAGRNGFTWPSLLENEEWNQYMATGMYRMPVKHIYCYFESNRRNYVRVI